MDVRVESVRTGKNRYSGKVSFDKLTFNFEYHNGQDKKIVLRDRFGSKLSLDLKLREILTNVCLPSLRNAMASQSPKEIKVQILESGGRLISIRPYITEDKIDIVPQQLKSFVESHEEIAKAYRNSPYLAHPMEI